jgi:hypothetical protein
MVKVFNNIEQSSIRTFIFRFGIEHKGLVNHIRGPGNFLSYLFSSHGNNRGDVSDWILLATFRTGFFSNSVHSVVFEQ